MRGVLVLLLLQVAFPQSIFEVFNRGISSLIYGDEPSCTDINDKPCIFPFMYDGLKFDQCTTHKSVNGRAWCSSEVDDYGYAQCHRKGNCEDCSYASCSADPPIPTASPPAPRDPYSVLPNYPEPVHPLPPPAPQCTIYGDSCIFPFRYKGRELLSCTTFDSENGKAWCATSVDQGGNAIGWEDCASCVGEPEFPPSPRTTPRPPRTTTERPSFTTGSLQASHEPIWQTRNCNRLRIRKDVTTLTYAEKKTLQTALNNAMSLPYKWENFQDIASFHGHSDGFNCTDPNTQLRCHKRPCPDKGAGSCCPHGSPDFLPWHRLYMVQLEELMEPWLAETSLGLPYWDWSKDWATIPDLWESISSPIKDSQAFYSSWSSSHCQGRSKGFSQRIKRVSRENGPLYKEISSISNDMRDTMNEWEFTRFSSSLSQNHNKIHIGLECTMLPVGTAAYDPIFWLHHSYVDKVFADWQYGESRPSLSKSTYLDPFSNREINKFYHRTHKTPDETLDYTKNLCYCYDGICNCQSDDEIFFVDEQGRKQVYHFPPNAPFAPPIDHIIQFKEDLLHKINQDMEIYVAVVVPKHIGGRVVKYRVCQEGANGEDCSEEDIIALFGLDQKDSGKEKEVNFEGFEIKENLFVPSWTLSEPVEAIKTWTRIEVLDGSDLVPSQAPPFFVFRFTSDRFSDLVAHLPVGVEKRQYGDLLDDYLVKNYCDSYDVGASYDLQGPGLTLDFGHSSICK